MGMHINNRCVDVNMHYQDSIYSLLSNKEMAKPRDIDQVSISRDAAPDIALMGT